jgi:EAL domain-containing protein (putative c-di-GMP-specific phosphodiesterase class I)
MLEEMDTAWADLIEEACEGQLMVPAFQPIVDTARGVVCGFEGLTRFTHPEAPPSPERWFVAAMMHGLSGRLEAASMRAMLGARRDLPPNCFLSVNVSPGALLAPEVREALEASGDLAGLVLEVTEQAPVEDYVTLGEVLAELRERGALVAVDDTGAGYAGLKHLLALRPEFVKLDRAVVSDVDVDPSRAAAIRAIGAFASELDAWLIAEGVERESELARLVELGVPLVQGYLLGRPTMEMLGIDEAIAAALRDLSKRQVSQPLSAMARPAPTVESVPTSVGEPTIVLDADGRPDRVVVPSGGRRASRHPAMCVQPSDDVRAVALRAMARHSEDRFAPLCLCDEMGRAAGLISIDAMLETFAMRGGHS